jgi:hypothetical protein
MRCRVRKCFIYTATKNTAMALNMAQQIWDNPKVKSPASVQELVSLLNSTALALQRVCDSLDYEHNEYNKL